MSETRDARTFEPGERVSAVRFGMLREGCVVAHNTPGIVWVRWDGSDGQAWAHAASLTPCDYHATDEEKAGDGMQDEPDMSCDSCAAVMVNGHYCHETGCPNARKVKIDGRWQSPESDEDAQATR